MPSLTSILTSHIAWSQKTFGSGRRTIGITKHIGKEVEEVIANPTDLEEWIDIVILALDGAWRAGYTPEEIEAGLVKKIQTNRSRTYPHPTSEDEPSEHER